MAVPAAGFFVGEAGAAAVGDGALSGYAGAPAQMVRLAHHMKLGTPEFFRPSAAFLLWGVEPPIPPAKAGMTGRPNRPTGNAALPDGSVSF